MTRAILHTPVLRCVAAGRLALLAVAVATPASAADVSTIAGNGNASFSGDGGPATAAALSGPADVAVAADGTVYVADSGNLRIRRISPGGVISTIAGNGTYGEGGDGDQATAAQLGSIEAIALSPADDILYISDNGVNRVRQVDLGSGVITTFAGRGLDYIGHDGNGGLATDARIGIPLGIAVDPTGNVYFAEAAYCAVRKVDIVTRVITRVAGSSFPGDCASDGDGGDALAARLSTPTKLATDAAGNLFVIEIGTNTVRRIDADTHIITTIAGGGSATPGFGDATTMDLGEIEGLAIDDANNLYVSNFSQVFKVDLDTGILTVFAGTGAFGFSGDGGSALEATFSNIWGLDVRGDALFIADSNNNRIRAVMAPVSPPTDLIVELTTSQALLDSLTAVPGSLLMINVDGREYLVVPNATQVGLDVTLTGNDQLLVIDLTALQSAAGNITISGNLVLQSVDLSDLTTVGGSLEITDNPALNAILISGVTSIGGDLTIIGTAATVIDLSSLTTVTGSLDISGNTAATTIDMGSLTTVSGDLSITGNTAAGTINAASLTTVSGSLDLSGNTTVAGLDIGGVTTVGGNLTISDAASATSIDASSLTTVGGSLSISDNPAASVIDAASLTTTSGALSITGNITVGSIDLTALTSAASLDISGNTSATIIDASSLTSVSGDLTIVNNGSAAVDASAGIDVGGNLTIETTGTGSFPMGDGIITGDLTLDTSGYTEVSGTTPGGALDVTAANLEAVMHLQVQAASFTTPVAFSATRLDPVALPPEGGADAGGAPATIDPIAAYQFTFAVPTLNRDAALSFDIDVAGLDAATQTALLDALAAGTATMVTKGDAPGSVFQAFPICGGADVPTVDGCVLIETFDSNGQPTSGTPAIVRFSNVVGHFSTWAVATVAAAVPTGICSTLDGLWYPDVHFFRFNGVKGEQVTVSLAADPAGTSTSGRAALALFGFGLLKGDASALPNSVTATLPRTGTFYASVAQLLTGTGRFSGDYCVRLQSSQNAWQTFRRQ